VLHHAIEKGHLEVLETMLQHGVDVYSAIEIADNAGRTALFEAVENAEETVGARLTQEGEPEDPSRIIKMLITKRANGGFGAKTNVVNFNGQTPMFSAVREGNFAAVKCLIELGDAKPDLNGGELVKIEEQDNEEEEDEYESQEEKYFMMAFKNCMSPLHVATVLGYDEIALYLIERAGADVDYPSGKRKYTPLHLAVLANKPEMIIELLTKTQADPMCEDWEGQSLLDMVYKYIPTYVESFQALLENLQMHRLKSAGTESAGKNIARHYIHPDDDRKI
jgi:ankyrin repeat protein